MAETLAKSQLLNAGSSCPVCWCLQRARAPQTDQIHACPISHAQRFRATAVVQGRMTPQVAPHPFLSCSLSFFFPSFSFLLSLSFFGISFLFNIDFNTICSDYDFSTLLPPPCSPPRVPIPISRIFLPTSAHYIPAQFQ